MQKNIPFFLLSTTDGSKTSTKEHGLNESERKVESIYGGWCSRHIVEYRKHFKYE